MYIYLRVIVDRVSTSIGTLNLRGVCKGGQRGKTKQKSIGIVCFWQDVQLCMLQGPISSPANAADENNCSLCVVINQSFRKQSRCYIINRLKVNYAMRHISLVHVIFHFLPLIGSSVKLTRI